MTDMNFTEYADKVLGAWMGKCVCGNIGAPFEGMKQRIKVPFEESMLRDMLPNDDLDLQVLFLDVAERFGADFTSYDLAEAFYRCCPYAPGEYAYFKKNYACGITPPLSGAFNNSVYKTGMGATIRSELWACLAPGDPAKAVEYARRDACLDHTGDGVEGEVFMAAFESALFSDPDIRAAAERALSFVKEGSRLPELVRLVLDITQKTDFEGSYDALMRLWGSAEATSVYQNIGIILINLIFGTDDLLADTVRTCGCGFDTDCTCATFGAVRGILQGGESLKKVFGTDDVKYALGVTACKRSGKVSDLAAEVVALRRKMEENGVFERRAAVFSAEYENGPSITFGETKTVVLTAANRTEKPLNLTLKPCSSLTLSQTEITVPVGGRVQTRLTATASDGELPKANPVEVMLGKEPVYRFGFAAANRFCVYGPFWKNNVEVPELAKGESYWKYFPSSSSAEQMDGIRFYHTNCLPRLAGPEEANEKNFLRTADVGCDVVDAALLPFDGQAAYFFKETIVLERDVTVDLQLGLSTPAEMWINGDSVVKYGTCTRYTPEAAHVFGVRLHRGENEILVRVSVINKDARFSFDFLEKGPCSNHFTDYKIKK